MTSKFDAQTIKNWRKSQAEVGRNLAFDVGMDRLVTQLGNISDKTVLDLGCGYGSLLDAIDCKHYTGVDNEPSGLAMITESADVSLISMDLETEFPEDHYDIAVCVLTSQYLGSYYELVDKLNVDRAVFLSLIADKHTDAEIEAPPLWDPEGIPIPIYYRTPSNMIAAWTNRGYILMYDYIVVEPAVLLFDVRRY